MKTKGCLNRGMFPHWILLISIVMWLALPGSGANENGSPRFYFQFNVTRTNPYAGHFGDFIEKSQVYFNSFTTTPGYTISTEKDSFFLGYRGEIGLQVKNIAIGFSAGFISRDFSVKSLYENPTDGSVETYSHRYRFSAVPIFLFLHYRLFNSRWLSGYLTVGEGVYLGKLRDDRSITYENNPAELVNNYVNSYIDATRNQLGFHFGTSIDIKLTGNIAISIEGAYRWVKFKDITAQGYYEDNQVTGVKTKGDYYLWENSRTGEVRFGIGKESPGARWSSTPVRLDLDGFFLGVGIKITLGSSKKKVQTKQAPLDPY